MVLYRKGNFIIHKFCFNHVTIFFDYLGFENQRAKTKKTFKATCNVETKGLY